jgi:hypothetical protein
VAPFCSSIHICGVKLLLLFLLLCKQIGENLACLKQSHVFSLSLLDPPQGQDYCIESNFWKFYLVRTSCTLGETVSLVKVFRWKWKFFGVQSVDTVRRWTTSYLLAGPACL